MRKIGTKNKVSFGIMIVLFILIISIFGYFISYELKKSNNTYNIASGSILFNEKNDYIELKNQGEITKGFDRNYYLTYQNDKKIYKEKIGMNTIVYKEGDYKLYFYGTAYMITNKGEVEKINNQTEIVKTTSPYFFKISDRKYLFVDKKISTEDESIKTTDYLIIELDKKGNATFTNYENNFKTIKPIILKGTLYDFDIANEKLIIDKDNQIDLKTIIGSSNTYKEEGKDTTNKDDKNYYDEYLNTIKNSFNNLVGSINENMQGEVNKEDVYIDLTKWTTLKSVNPNVNSINIKYTVFDPNNEYSEVFVYLENNEKIQLSKTDDSYLISNLTPDTMYNLTYGYKTIKNESTDVITDNIKVKTNALNYQIKITKVTTNKIYYTVIFNNDYIPDSAEITFYSNNNQINSNIIFKNQIDKNNTYNGYFSYNSLDYIISLKLHNIYYDSVLINYSTYAKFIN